MTGWWPMTALSASRMPVAPDMTIALAQAVPIDPSLWGNPVVYGPMGFMVMACLWQIGRLEKRNDDQREAHKIEIATERALNSKQQDVHVGDLKLMFPLSEKVLSSVEYLKAREEKLDRILEAVDWLKGREERK